MEALLIYSAKVTLSSGVMFLYYRLFLKDRTFHHYNRFYLLSVLIISFLLPFLRLDYFTIELNQEVYILLNGIKKFHSSPEPGFSYVQFIATVAGVVSAFFVVRLAVGIARIHRFTRIFNKESFDGINFYRTDLPEAPFSFFKNLFWNDSLSMDSELGRQILKHEMVHIEQKHSRDKLLFELSVAVFWFNPFLWLIKKEICLIHEYLADHKALQNSDTKAFAQMLLASHFSGKQLTAASPLLSSNLKKRLTMLKKSKTPYSYARKILALPLLFALAFAYMVNAKNNEIIETNSMIVQEVSALKKDTINIDQIRTTIDESKTKAEPLYKEMKEEEAAIKKLADKMQQKGKELQLLSAKKDFDSPKYQKLQKEMDQLSDNMEKIYDSPAYKEKWKKMEMHFQETDGLFAKLDQYYSSDAFKLKIQNAEKRAKEAEALVNSPAFKKRIADAEKRAKEAEELVNSPAFKKRIADGEKRAKEAEALVNSPAFKKRIAEAEKRAKEAEKMVNSPQFKQRIKDAEQRAQEAEKAAVSPVRPTRDAVILIDGKPSTEEEMQKLDPARIESVNVFKKGYQSADRYEIRVVTKK